LPMPNLEKDYQNLLKKTRKQLDDIIAIENKGGMHIDVLIREGEPAAEVLALVEERKIDLLIMLAHEEGRIEHFLFGRSNEALIRKMPCSVFLVKKEPGRAGF
jgi:universal stress protein A